MRPSIHSRGFTLIEVLVAIALVAGAVTLSYRALSSVIGGTDSVSTRLDSARDVDRLFARLENELNQRQPDYPTATLHGGHENGAGHLSFQSVSMDDNGIWGVQNFTYRLNRDELSLTIEDELSNDTDSPPRQEILFRNVTRFTLRFMGANNAWQDKWEPGAAFPRAVEVRLKVGTEDAIRVFALP